MVKPKLAVGDFHAPFELWNYVRFLKRVKKDHGCGEVISIGDLVDLHTISRFLNSPNAEGTKREWAAAKESIKILHGELGLSKVCVGNHDARLLRRTRDSGLPDEWIRDLNEIYGLKHVEFADEFVIDDVLYIHGIASGGESGWQDFSKKNGMSAVIGHNHSIGGIRYHSMRNGKSLYTLSTGCGIDRRTYAFEYAKGDPKLPVIGAGVIYSDTRAYFEPLDLGDRRNTRRD